MADRIEMQLDGGAKAEADATMLRNTREVESFIFLSLDVRGNAAYCETQLRVDTAISRKRPCVGAAGSRPQKSKGQKEGIFRGSQGFLINAIIIKARTKNIDSLCLKLLIGFNIRKLK